MSMRKSYCIASISKQNEHSNIIFSILSRRCSYGIPQISFQISKSGPLSNFLQLLLVCSPMKTYRSTLMFVKSQLIAFMN